MSEQVINDGELMVWERERLVMDLNDTIAAFREEMAPVLERIQELDEQIKEHVISRQETLEYGNSKVTFRKGYSRTSWDNKALEGFAAVHPEILAFRKETQVKPTVAMSPKVEGI